MSKLDAAFKRELIRKIEKADFALEDAYENMFYQNQEVPQVDDFVAEYCAALEDIAYEALTEVLEKVKLQISVDIED